MARSYPGKGGGVAWDIKKKCMPSAKHLHSPRAKRPSFPENQGNETKALRLTGIFIHVEQNIFFRKLKTFFLLAHPQIKGKTRNKTGKFHTFH